MKKDRTPKARLVWNTCPPPSRPLSWGQFFGGLFAICLIVGVGLFLAIKVPPLFAIIVIFLAREAGCRR